MLAPGAGRLLLPTGLLLVADLLALGLVGWGHGVPELAIAVLLAGLLGFLLVFFRDPERATGEGIVSAADGKVRAVERSGGCWNVSVFMNVTDVHVNRVPLDGTVATIAEGGEGFRPAYAPQAERNVRRHYRLGTEVGDVEVVQITGILARRLVSFVAAGTPVRKGDRLGMIVLGSRVDVLLPAERTVPTVTAGQRVIAGVTTIARVRP